MKREKSIITLILIILSPVWLFFVFILIVVVYDSFRLQTYANSLFHYPLPPKTKIISKKAEWIDTPNGSPSSVDYITMKIETFLTQEEVDKYYSKLDPIMRSVIWVSVDIKQSPATMTIETDGGLGGSLPF